MACDASERELLIVFQPKKIRKPSLHAKKDDSAASMALTNRTVMTRLEETMSRPIPVPIPTYLLDSRDFVGMIRRHLRSSHLVQSSAKADDTSEVAPRIARAVYVPAMVDTGSDGTTGEQLLIFVEKRDEESTRRCGVVVYEAANPSEVAPDKVFQVLAARAVDDFNVPQDW
ncbi:hypothetical protein GGF32_005980 [Allomyces javanicus]|nr:hypothetical protein GGF32_005980 [Allomyces javanicus]